MSLKALFSRMGKGSESMTARVSSFDDLIPVSHGRDALFLFVEGRHDFQNQYAMQACAQRYNVLSNNGAMLGDHVVPMQTKVWRSGEGKDVQTFVTCLPEQPADTTKRIHLVFEECDDVKRSLFYTSMNLPTPHVTKLIEQICLLTGTYFAGARKIRDGLYVQLEGTYATPEAFVAYLKSSYNKSKDTP